MIVEFFILAIVVVVVIEFTFMVADYIVSVANNIPIPGSVESGEEE